MAVIWAHGFEAMAGFAGTTRAGEGGGAAIKSFGVACISSRGSLQFRVSVIFSMVGI